MAVLVTTLVLLLLINSEYSTGCSKKCPLVLFGHFRVKLVKVSLLCSKLCWKFTDGFILGIYCIILQ